MKPEGPVARVSDYAITPIPHAAALRLMRDHYAKGGANTSVYAHGLFRGGELVGAALWMPPLAGAAKLVARLADKAANLDRATYDHRRVLALSRLFVAPGEPKNAAGLFLAASTRLIQKSGRYDALVTYADSNQGHLGTVYKATGWTAAGDTAPKASYVDDQGRQVSHVTAYGRSPEGRRLTTSLSRDEMLALGHTFQGYFHKHRFIKILRRVRA